MVAEVLEGTLEARIFHFLLEKYPVTTKGLERELKGEARAPRPRPRGGGVSARLLVRLGDSGFESLSP